jgi:hypothetical protein
MRVISSNGHTYCVFISDSTSVIISAAIWNETSIYYSLHNLTTLSALIFRHEPAHHPGPTMAARQLAEDPFLTFNFHLQKYKQYLP